MSKTIVLMLFLLLITFFFYGCLTSTEESDGEIRSIQIDILIDVDFNWLVISESGSTTTAHSQTGHFNKGRHTIELRTTLNEDTRYDLQLHTADGSTATKRHILLSQNAIVEFELSDFDDDTAYDITTLYIRNRTGIDFSYIYVGVAGSGSWLFGINGNIANDTNFPLTNITPPLNTATRYDIQLREQAAGGIRATRGNILLRQNETIIFLESNI